MADIIRDTIAFCFSLTFNVIVDSGLIYLSASDSASGNIKPFAFLSEVKSCVQIPMQKPSAFHQVA
jgi:hypothetical protein